MTNLSDEDREAIFALRCLLEGRNPFCKTEHWERVLKLAGEEPGEPADQTFWLDEDNFDVWVRDDRATGMVYGPSNLDRWWKTGSGENFSWIDVCRLSPKLVELVRKADGAR